MSRDFVPPRPSGFDREARFDQSTHDKTHGPSARFNDSSTVKVKRTTKGYSWHAIRAKGSTSTPSPVRATVFLVLGDHLVCKLFGTSTQVKVAKAPWMRLSITSEVIDTVTVNYTNSAYSAPAKYQRRDATPNPGTAEKQVTYPFYAIGQEIWITPITPFDTSDSPSVSATYIETHARVWLRKVDQTT